MRGAAEPPPEPPTPKPSPMKAMAKAVMGMMVGKHAMKVVKTAMRARKRMRGKQKDPREGEETREKNNPMTPVAITIVNPVRSKPAYRSMVQDNVVWAEEEKTIPEAVNAGKMPQP